MIVANCIDGSVRVVLVMAFLVGVPAVFGQNSEVAVNEISGGEGQLDLPESEFSLISANREGPDPESSKYLVVTESIGQREVLFNAIERERIYDVKISGHVVVIDERTEKNDIWKRFNRRRDLRQMHISANHVIIASHWDLPQTNIVIQAKQISLIRDGVLKTTPLGFEKKAEGASRESESVEAEIIPARDGANGHAAGDIYLLSENLFVEEFEGPRFVLNGGNGQSGGEGLHGADGRSVPEVKSKYKFHYEDSNSTGWLTTTGWLKICGGDPQRFKITYFKRGNTVLGTKQLPGNGGNAIPGGNPGNGGEGGVLYTLAAASDIQKNYEARGGSAGMPTKSYSGGKPGKPREVIQFTGNTKCSHKKHETFKGVDSVRLVGIEGEKGKVVDGVGLETVSSLSFLTVEALQARRRYAGDQYIAGKLVDAYLSLQSIQSLLEKIEDFAFPTEDFLEESVKQVVSLPSETEPIVAVDPVYPRQAENNNIVGEVSVEYTVDRKGNVRNAKIVESKPSQIFDRQAIRAILRFRYPPAESERKLLWKFRFPPIQSDLRESNIDYDSLRELRKLKIRFGTLMSRMIREVMTDERLASLQLESESMLHGISSGLDYYGNPAGWYPGLSLEIIQVAHQSEIKSAFETLWLAKLIERKVKNRQAAIGEMKKAQQGALSKLAELTVKYNSIQTALPELRSRLGGVANEASLREQELIAAKQRIELAWRERKEREQRRARRKGRLSAFGNLLSMSPVGQPMLAGVGTVISMTQNREKRKEALIQAERTAFQESLRAAGAKLGEIRRASLEEREGTAGGTTGAALDPAMNEFSYRPFQTSLSSIDELIRPLTEAQDNKASRNIKRQLIWNEDQTANDWISNVSTVASQFQPMVDAMRELRTTRPQISTRERQAELARLQAGDSEFQSLKKSLETLDRKRQEYRQEIDQAIAKSGQILADIGSTANAIDQLGKAISRGLGQQDHGAMIYVKDMAARAERRLEKYHYWFSKAFEYRFLEPYPGQFQMADIRERLQTMLEERIVAQEGSLAVDLVTLDRAEFEALRAIYREQLQQVAEAMLDKLESSSFMEHSITYRLDGSELERLNTEQVLLINPWRKGLIPYDRINIRIEDIDVSFTADWSHQTVNSFLEIRVEHSGEGVLRGRDDYFRFGHQNGDAQKSSFWSATLKPDSQKLTAVEPSNDNFRVLTSLYRGVGVGRLEVEEMRLVSRPPAIADLVLRKRDLPFGSKSDLSSVVLTLSTDFEVAPDYISQVHVKPKIGGQMRFQEEDLYSVVGISNADESGRKDGEGEFMRLYRRGSQIRLSAEESFGRLVFDGWSEPYPPNSTIEGRIMEVLVDGTDIMVRPIYRAAEN